MAAGTAPNESEKYLRALFNKYLEIHSPLSEKEEIVANQILVRLAKGLSVPVDFSEVADGKSRVLLLKDRRLVIKFPAETDRWDHRRIEKAQLLKKAFAELEIETCIVPDAKRALIGDTRVTIERMLPILSKTESIQLLMKEPERFHKTAVELTRFFMFHHMGDLGTYNSEIRGVDVRYDNLPLFTLGKEGRIGFIDPEHFTYGKAPQTQEEAERNLFFVARVFPKSVEHIIAAGKEYGYIFDEDELRRTAASQEACYNNYYLGFLSHIRDNDIDTTAPFSLPEGSIRQECVEAVHSVLKGLREEEAVVFKDDVLEAKGISKEEALLDYAEYSYAFLFEEGTYRGETQPGFLTLLREKYPEVEAPLSDKEIFDLRTGEVNPNTRPEDYYHTLWGVVAKDHENVSKTPPPSTMKPVFDGVLEVLKTHKRIYEYSTLRGIKIMY